MKDALTTSPPPLSPPWQVEQVPGGFKVLDATDQALGFGSSISGLRSHFRLGWMRLWGGLALAGIVFASVMLPTSWEKLRTGHWAIEHFVAYFAATLILCLGWRRPFLVAGVLAAIVAPLLEVIQIFTPNHSASLLSVLSGAAGALAAALLVTLVIRGRRERDRPAS